MKLWQDKRTCCVDIKKGDRNMVYPKFGTRPYPITMLFLYMFPVQLFHGNPIQNIS